MTTTPAPKVRLPTVAPAALWSALSDNAGDDADIFAAMRDSHRLAFSPAAVIIERACVERITTVIAAIESVLGRPDAQDAILAQADPVARTNHGPLGAFISYDFHLTAAGPKLIEINTNAGGGLLLAAAAKAHQALNAELAGLPIGPTAPHAVADVFLDMLAAEHRRQFGDRPLVGAAIVDDAPAAQYMHPEFVLFQRAMTRRGWNAVIRDAKELRFEDRAIDLVYNRCTDFALAEPEHAALRRAYVDGVAAITPNPRAHALFADKNTLALLSDDDHLGGWNLSPDVRAAIAAGVPRTRLVATDQADALWAARRGLFFKPASGFGSKAAYRGDKLTKRAFADIMAGRYVAQDMVPPSEHVIRQGDGETQLKLDLRAFVHAGTLQFFGARLYQGQTTNFRTEGGGFAPVFISS